MLEIIVAIALFTIIIMLSGSMYTLSQRAYNKGEVRGELAQNARVSLDRISREIRQSVDIVTDLSATTTEIFFQDGHDISQITYLRYYLNGTDLQRGIVVYYFEIEPEVYVTYNSTVESGDPPEEDSENKIVGEYFSNLQFWVAGGLVYI